MSDTQPVEVEDDRTEICGDTYDHDIDPRAYEDTPEGPWECCRCYAEIWPEEE